MSKSRKTFRSKKKVIGYGFVGEWLGGQIGWSLPHYLTGYAGQNEPPSTRDHVRHKPHYLCRITVERIHDSRGRPIVRYPGGK